MYFSAAYSKTLREKNPDQSLTDIAKLVGVRWGELSDKEKAPYEKQNEQDKVRQQNQKDEVAKKGYFMMPDGSKSTDTQNIPKKRKSKLATPQSPS
jgi:hypothetical protein